MATKKICAICKIEKPGVIKFPLRDENYCPTCERETKTIIEMIDDKYSNVINSKHKLAYPNHYPVETHNPILYCRSTIRGHKLYYILDKKESPINIFIIKVDGTKERLCKIHLLKDLEQVWSIYEK